MPRLACNTLAELSRLARHEGLAIFDTRSTHRTRFTRTMRLLNTLDPTLEGFVGDCPIYAILSHCWDDEEVVFSDLADITGARKRQGFNNVQKACKHAVKDCFDWVWIDTCCIDKSSSAELS